MSSKIVVGPIKKGLKNDVLPFNIDNDSFPKLLNAYQWRSRVKRKRGTVLLGRLRRPLSSGQIGTTDGGGAFSGTIFSLAGVQGSITAITNANPGQVTSANHNLSNGDLILITGVGGMTQVNGLTFTVTVVNTNAFTIGVNTIAFGVYTTGGTWELVAESNASVQPGSLSITINTQTFSDQNSDGVIIQQTGVGYVTTITNITLPTSTSATLSIAAHNFTAGQTVYVSGVNGMTEINGGYYVIASTTAGSITVTTPINSAWGAYTSGGTAKRVAGSINYATGALTVQTTPVLAGTAVTINFSYFPDLPVMGLEDLVIPTNAFPGTLAFDPVYSYNINTTSPFTIFNVTYYKNPSAVSPTVAPGYTPKAANTPFTWNGQDYQQFWTTNYQGALWATNGIEVPFDTTNIGMQFKPIVTTTIVAAGPPARVTLQITAHGLILGDFVFVNEVLTTTGINYQTGFVDTVTDANNVIVQFPTSTVANNGTGGIAQYLTNTADPTKDCIRFYDGAPVSSATPPVFITDHGWVNFMPPLILAPETIFSIADQIPGQYYLVGAKALLPFKDRLVAFGAVIQTSTGVPIYLQDTIIFSQNGTPYYTVTFPYSTVSPTASVLATAVYKSMLLPANQTATANAWFENIPGYGSFQTIGLEEPITTVVNNEDVLIIGFTNHQVRLVYTGNDILPFNFYIINGELGSSSTFSSINMDRGAISIGPRGIIITSQTSAQRIDLEIPDQVFQFNLANNGRERVTAQRDYISEWIYFSYSPADALDYFPEQTLFYNYRDNSWGIFNECYTTYGQFRRQSGQTWDDLTEFPWSAWTDPWDSGEQTLFQPEIIGGNQQGFVLIRDEGTDEDPSGYIENIDASSVVTSPHHNLNDGDFIIITGVLGTIADGVNGKIFSIASPGVNTFTLNPTVPSGTYLGGGVFTRLYRPEVQTKQFPMAWDMGRKTRIGSQQYLLTKTGISQITLLIFLSQDSSDPFNDGPVIPNANVTNSGLIYTTVLYTCTESTNLGLTQANSSLMMLAPGQPQAQIWHRVNTSLLGDTVQLGFTLSDAQMRTYSDVGEVLSITNATQANPCVLTVMNSLTTGTNVKITGVQGMTQLNGNYYTITAQTSTTLTINVDSTNFTAYRGKGFVTPAISAATQAAQLVITISNNLAIGSLVRISDVRGMIELNGNVYLIKNKTDTTLTLGVDSTAFSAYVSGGIATPVAPVFQFDEIELHGMVLHVSPSQLLA